MQHKVQLTVHEPPVEIIWRDTEVKCGKTSVNVREYGHVGTGDWAVWTSLGHTIDGTTPHQPRSYDDAREAAVQYVLREEVQRLMFEQLRAEQAKAIKED